MEESPWTADTDGDVTSDYCEEHEFKLLWHKKNSRTILAAATAEASVDHVDP